MMLAMVESVTGGEGEEPLVAIFLAKRIKMLQGLLFDPCKVSDCATHTIEHIVCILVLSRCFLDLVFGRDSLYATAIKTIG